MRVLSLFDGKYEVHSDGTVWSNVGKKKPLIGKIAKCGYRMIVLNVQGKKQYPLVHRLVAQAFIPNPENIVLLCRKCHMFVHSRRNTEKLYIKHPN